MDLPLDDEPTPCKSYAEMRQKVRDCISNSGKNRSRMKIAQRILDGIRSADLIIADVSERNPNVLYEVGFGHALRKRTILLFNIKSGYGLPIDLTGFECITYDLVNLRDLADRVKAETSALLLQRSA